MKKVTVTLTADVKSDYKNFFKEYSTLSRKLKTIYKLPKESVTKANSLLENVVKGMSELNNILDKN